MGWQSRVGRLGLSLANRAGVSGAATKLPRPPEWLKSRRNSSCLRKGVVFVDMLLEGNA